MVRIFVTQELSLGSQVHCEPDMRHHLQHVMRKNCGDTVTVIDKLKNEYEGKIIKIASEDLVIEICKHLEIRREPRLEVTVFQGLPKRDKMELIISKGTEIGACRFVPVEMARSVVKVQKDKVQKKLARWNKIALAAARQAHRQIIPEVAAIVKFAQMLDQLKAYDLIVVPYEEAQLQDLATVELEESIKRVALVIGPEGGLEKQEVAQLKECGGEIVTLGPRILRTETAGFVALTVLLFRSGDLGGY